MTNSEISGQGPSQASLSGLSDAEAAERLRTEGYNELPRTGQRTFARIVVDVLREPMLAMLIGAGLIYMALGDLQEALILVAFAGLSILITVVQETRTERALEALRDLGGSDRDTGCCHDPLHRQDRHADAEPDADSRTASP
ncbi:cation-transporting P-type ATPase [Qipengyuania sp. YIM B01966]|jgi:Ca2+-transporting ATPase|uniref:cation-transporting P-type ATPase n=1 Tax=Qipengyuania sp. YIM B01966 TaxID=2778646 RepID=UPI00351C3744